MRIRDASVRKGSIELLVLSLLEERERHGYELAKLIGTRSGGAIVVHVASLYPLLYRLERNGLIQGRWVERAGSRRRRFYRLMPEGQETLAAQRKSWRMFFSALNRVASFRHA